MTNYDQIFIAPAAMGCSVYLYILHDIQKAYFCDEDPVSRDVDDNGDDLEPCITEQYGMNTLNDYGNEIEYNKAMAIYNALKNE